MNTKKRFLVAALTFLLALSLLLPAVMQRPAADTQTGFILLSPGRDGQMETSDDMYATEKGDAVKGAAAVSLTDAVPSSGKGKTAATLLVNQISGGYFHNLAVSSNTIWAWGLNNYGQLGDGTTTNGYTPVQVKGLSDVVAVSAGQYHSLALKSDGTVWAWGYNGDGELGDGTTTNRYTPVQVQNLVVK
ncbi:RCC1 domain-containing protein [Thermoanaerobacter mathranii]|uniref:RCC1 domain-containing protein n=1 Tax=Thermoanaerobacter mathranii TaxID=583357 RepID=UPI003D6A6A3E